MSVSEEIDSTFPSQRPKSNADSEASTSYEVFRNMTTAVEVIVKELPRSKNKSGMFNQDTTLTMRLRDDVDRLQNKLNKANSSLEKSHKGFKICVQEMKKQLNSAYQREADAKTKNLILQLENEKLKTLLNSKTNLMNKLRKELCSMKRIIKFVVKNILYVPQLDLVNLSCSSDAEYNEFERNLKRDFKVKFATFDETGTFDSSISKEAKNTIDNSSLEQI